MHGCAGACQGIAVIDLQEIARAVGRTIVINIHCAGSARSQDCESAIVSCDRENRTQGHRCIEHPG